jgi:DNA polymerase III delta prime subunit
MTAETKTVNVMRWIPDRWDQFVGNRRMKAEFRRIVQRLRKHYKDTGRIPAEILLSLLLIGPSRSGKTAMTKFAVRCLVCQELDDDLNPCKHTCPACRQRPEFEGQEGMFSVCAVAHNSPLVNFIIADCTKLQTAKELQEVLDKSQGGLRGLDCVYLDEVHRLVPKHLDEILLKEVEDKDCLWILSTAKPNDLDTMLRNRLITLETELPDEEELAEWIADRCDDWGIPWDTESVIKGSHKVNRVPGLALRGLAMAATNPEGLTPDIIDRYW